MCGIIFVRVRCFGFFADVVGDCAKFTFRGRTYRHFAALRLTARRVNIATITSVRNASMEYVALPR